MRLSPVYLALPLLAMVVPLSAAGTPYAPDWAGIAPKRVIQHPGSDGATPLTT